MLYKRVTNDIIQNSNVISLNNEIYNSMRVLNSKMRIVLGLLIISMVLMLPIGNSLFSSETDVVVKIPTLKVNMYAMGMQEIDQQVYLNIGENLEYLNQEFEGSINFVLGELFMDQNGAYLPDLFEDFKAGDQNMIERLVNPLEQPTGVNVFIFNTYCEDGTDNALMGFTPVLRSSHYRYEGASPNFDRIFIAYEGLEDKTTLVHEMGHFLGLKHPWEMTEYARKSLGIQRFNVARNHMNYGYEVDQFTTRQLESMRRHAVNYRSYLTEDIRSIVLKP